MSDKRLEKVAGNGLISRRHLLRFGASGAGLALSAGALGADQGLSFQIPTWSRQPGPGATAYGTRSPFADNLQRLAAQPNPTYPGGGSSRSPLQDLQGTITPNSLHFERHHAGVPNIDPSQHMLVINGLVRQPLAFRYEDLLKYQMVSRIHFLECSGNSGALLRGEIGGSAQSLHGLVSCAEWTGVPLSTLLDEAGVLPEAAWVAAVGADAASMGRSIPLTKALDDVMVALYQNGEAVRPGQGYPMRLFCPGWEGNVSVKWLTQIKVTQEPAQFRDETSKYTDTLQDRSSYQFTFPMGTKSLITSPSGQMTLNQPGIYQVTGIAWSGRGSIRQVEVSADGGKTWAEAAIQGHQLDRALTRFTIPWEWDGGDAILQSRATDSRGNLQPTRDEVIASRGTLSFYHNPCIQSWQVDQTGEISNVYV
ncbi:MAG: sulfite dehydrogenase [Pseudohongiellaceae bacterium]|nr:sulfite dehydrogenase [Gammaproteobacteria bacterium]|tara:strand:- start:121 stop:1389 length:1269 start_codon:yes stop_codon:yes gene_type:complete